MQLEFKARPAVQDMGHTSGTVLSFLRDLDELIVTTDPKPFKGRAT